MAGDLNTAEKYGLSNEPWLDIANSRQKTMYCISVCEHSRGLYLSRTD